MGISDVIACFINEMLEGEGGCAELQRSALASRFHCVPSQINYVISTRFSPEYGYIVESRRGGNGYIRIRRVLTDKKQQIMHAVNAVGEELDSAAARAYLSNLVGCGAVEETSAELMAAALGENALRCIPEEFRDSARAGIFKQMLIRTVCEGSV